MRPFLAVPLIFLGACASASLAGPVRGRVVDESGLSVAGAEVRFAPGPSEVLLSGPGGEFEGEYAFRSKYEHINVLVVDRERRRGGLRPAFRNGGPVTIVAEPLTRVTGRVAYDRIPKPILEAGPRWIRITKPPLFQFTSGFDWGEEVASAALDAGDFEFLLPAGHYTATVFGHHQWLSRSFAIDKSQGTLELGTLEALLIPGHEIYGSPAPELRLADARGIATDGGLAALRGKWVLLILWDRRMRVNVHWLTPAMSFYAEHPEYRDRLEIVGVHNGDDVSTVQHLESARTWEAGTSDWKTIPFPVGIDDHEKTFNAYGMARGLRRQSPLVVLINPEGVVTFNPGFDNVVTLLKSKLGVD